MPKTPPTIVAPLPHDPRVMALAKSVSLTRREAFAAAAEAWAWMSVMAVEDIVPQTAPDSLDAVVGDIDGFGQAMLQAGLVGTVDGGLVLPAELRQLQQRDERGVGAAASAAAVDDKTKDGKTRRRKAQNAAASRTYRRKTKVTNPKPKPSSSGNAWRSLGHVAGHEVRAFDGPHGVYVMLLGATVGGATHKLTAGNKAWSLDTVTLAEALPGLLDKWKTVHQKESGRLVPMPLLPAYSDFRDEAARVSLLAKLGQETSRHADAADASSRHADASATVSRPSATPEAETEQKPNGGMGLDASAASSFRDADALSSMSVCSTSSSSIEEDEMRGEGSKAAADHEPAVRDRLAKHDEGRQQAARIAEALGLELEIVLYRGRTNPQFLALQCREAGIDPRTGLPLGAEAPGEPKEARGSIDTTPDTTTGNTPATGDVEAPGEDVGFHETSKALNTLGITRTVNAAPPPGEDEEPFEDKRRRIRDQLLRQGA